VSRAHEIRFHHPHYVRAAAVHLQLKAVAHDCRLDANLAIYPSSFRIEEKQVVPSEDDPLAMDVTENDRVIFGLNWGVMRLEVNPLQ